MITVISGTPGAGKTAYVVAELAKLFDQGDPGRPIFVLGISDLTLPVAVCPPVETWVERVVVPEDPTLLEYEFTFPDGALIVVDEAQKVYRPRSSGSKVPPHVVALEKHRHKGLDFWLITQFPNLLDTQVRALTGRHIHVQASWSGRRLQEWSEIADPRSHGDLARASSRPYTLPASAFSLYRSASMHVDVPRRRPLAFYALFVLIGLAALLGGLVYHRVDSHLQADQIAQSNPSSPASVTSAVAVSPPSVVGNAVTDKPKGVELREYVPRITARPETAPLYDDLRKPKQMPIVKGCVDLRGDCRCFTQQGTRVHDVTPAQCRLWLSDPPFDPWSSPPTVAQTTPVDPVEIVETEQDLRQSRVAQRLREKSASDGGLHAYLDETE